ncbi:hypothetical protein AB0E12_06980 [Micromonospora chersina]|uniref:hypothetical protein n=1 Tax=Micromonospora chersina TaxID=47854 RepID=UPI003404A05E
MTTDDGKPGQLHAGLRVTDLMSLSLTADAVRTHNFHRDRHDDFGKQAPLDALASNSFA